jgi:surface antigen
MKNIVTKLTLILLSFTIAACSSNTRSENTGIGVASGAVIGGLAGSAFGAGTGHAVAIGVGAVAGAIAGGLIGHDMDSSDNQKVSNTMSNNPTNKVSKWTAQNGTHYKVAPTSNRMSMNGNNYCRRYHSTMTVNGQTQHMDGVACRQSNGSWVAVNPQG